MQERFSRELWEYLALHKGAKFGSGQSCILTGEGGGGVAKKKSSST